jgi:alkanesulfonate monooxygenase SsuD/methylene tetrahydromethanopterin reductase-like flavin-dependent oxidoreductase (luciferase family)
MSVEVGVRMPHGQLANGSDALRAFGRAVEEAGLDRIWVGDHVSFKGGKGGDGLLDAMALAAVTNCVTIETAVYLLPLRHPLPVARQVATVAMLARDRFVFGVGIGGEHQAEVTNCGVDPATRGRRMDESLAIVRRLLGGEVVDHHGEQFHLAQASIVPTPDSPVPIVVGGRSDAALRRAGRLGDGWLGVWVASERFAANVARVAEAASEYGRSDVPAQHGFLAWCGIGERRESARAALTHAMESFYGLPFERFERSSPYGTVDDVTAALAPYVSAGARSLLLTPITSDGIQEIDAVSEVRARLKEKFE